MSKKYIISYLIFILLLVVGFIYLHDESKVVPVPVSSVDAFPGIQTSLIPWVPELDHLKERLVGMGLPVLKEEGTALHTHQHIDIFINGSHVDIPAGIGINEKAGFISPIHVHDEKNIIHVESPTIQKFTLLQFFDIWGVLFSDDCIGGYCSDGVSKLKVFINGKEVPNNFRDIELTSHEEIVITYGKEKDIPSPVPASFDFPAGL